MVDLFAAKSNRFSINKNKRTTQMKRLLFVIAGLALFTVQTNRAQMQPPPLKLQATVVPSMMNSLSVLLVWPDVNVAIYPSPENFIVYKKKAGISDSGKFEFVWMTREGKFMDHKVELGMKYSYYVVAKYHNQPDIFSDTVEVLVSEVNNVTAKASGNIFDETTLAPLGRARVEFIPTSMMFGPPSFAISDSAGNFKLKLKPGEYFIFAGAEGYLPEFFDNVIMMQQATKVNFKNGDSLSFAFGLKKFVLPNIFSIAGNVKDVSGNPQKALITAVTTNRKPNHMPEPQGHSFTVRTDDAGNFKIYAKENDTLVLFITPFNHALQKQFYNGKTTFETADRIVVNQNITGVDVTLAAKVVYANGISGTVNDSATASPLKAKVYAYQKRMNNRNGSRNFVLTDSLTGSYSLANLEPGTYYLLAAARGYRPSFFKYDGTSTHNWRNADSVVVTDAGIVTDINFKLNRIDTTGSAIVYGYIHDGNGNNVEGAVATLINENGVVVNATISDLDGSFVMEGLSSGSYQLTSSMVDYSASSQSNVTLESANNYVSADIVVTSDAVTGVESSNNNAVVSSYSIDQNYPNPFNPTTVISYQLPANGLVTIKVYNVIGKEIATLVNEYQQSGKYSKTFSANELTSGVYFYTIKSGSFSATKKMILLK